MSDTIQNLLITQYSLITQMSKFIDNTKKAAKAKRTHGFYVSRVNGWHELWQRYLANEHEICLAKTPAVSTHEYFTEDLFSKQEALFYEFKGELVDIIANLEKDQKSLDVSSSPNTTNTTESKSAIQTALPRISLPKFSGNYHEWISFRDLYLSVIHQNESLENVQKFHYLKTTLTGEAASIIKHFSISNANYSSAWRALTQRYDNKRFLVTSLLKTFTSQPKILNESASAIKNLLDVTCECLESLNNLQVNTVHWDPLIIHLLIQKLPPETHKAWETSIGDSSDIPEFTEFKKFLELRFRTLEAVAEVKPKSFNSTAKRSNENQSNSRLHNFHASKASCKLCHHDHAIRSCPNFLKLDGKTRLNTAKSKGCCTNCLGYYHSVNKCLSSAKCAECGEKHHTLLHSAFHKRHNEQVSNNKKKVSPQALTCPNNQDIQPSSSNILTHFVAKSKQILLATAVIYIQTSCGLQAARALIDPGSQATFITTSAVRRLKLKTTSTVAKITGLGNTETGNAKKMTQLTITSSNNDRQVEVDAIILDTLTDLLPSKALNQNIWKHITGLPLADPTFYKPNQIDVLIGADIYPLILLEGVKIGPIGTPVAQNTIFGWILSGHITNNNTRTSKPRILSLINTLDLKDELQKFWELEEVRVIKRENPEDIICEKFYQNTHFRKADGSYVVRLPFKVNDHSELGHSRNIALHRLLSTEKNAEKKGFLNEYNTVLEEYLSSNHMRPVKSQEKPLTHHDRMRPNKTNYLPHHGVIKTSSSTTKLRVVFDASCKTSTGVSLDDLLMTGPSLQRDITAILLQWRFHKYVFSADIEKMYRQIWLHPNDVDFQRVLWRSHPNQPIKDYCLLTVTFGVSCAPYLAIRTLHQLADDEKTTFPNASRCLLNDFYVDDVLTGGDTIKNVNFLKNDLIALLKKGCFHLRKFSANHPDILKDLPADDISTEALLHFNEDISVKALGIIWNPMEDTFRYKLNLDLNGPITKRSILSKIAKLYDPLGWLSPVVVCGKIFMQKLWLAGLDWDSKLPPHLEQEWQTFSSDLKMIEKLKIPRWINYLTKESVEFHGFCDSSERAYAAVIYARITKAEGIIHTHLIISKTKVAPTKVISLPRLELCGAHLLSKLVQHLRELLGKEVPCYLWTDSTIVLNWVNSSPNRWKSFIANRVSDIQTNAAGCSWHHVPTADNPADHASRGMLPSELLKRTNWWKGPKWLSEKSDQWPLLHPSIDSIPAYLHKELKRVKSYRVEVKTEYFAEKFSSYTKACRVLAYCRRFITRCKKEDTVWTPYLSTEELKFARQYLIKESQNYTFSEEIQDLKEQHSISKGSPLLSLNPFLDEENILRVGGRLEHSNLSFEEKHPIILSRDSTLVLLLIDHIHQITMHGGPNLLLAILRKRYWIPGVKAIIRKRIHLCITCFRWKAQPATQIMGDLPNSRVTLERPFYAVGIDFAGPINIKLSKIRNAKTTKAYIAVFVCFATKAIHIEVVSDLSSDAFLASLKRFFSRRGVSKEIYSDNATNFVGASKILEKEIHAAVKHNIQVAAETYANQNVTWHFIPPGAPHFGGLWEAGVKSIKFHLRRIVGQALLTFEELSTLLTQIEAILNSRPLCALTSNPEDFTPLTPGHFLIGDAPLSLPERDWSKAKLSHLSRWQHLQKLKYDFWKRWSSEYLPRLQQRMKWKTEQPAIHKGDLILLKEDNLPPSAWKLARITEIYRGKDFKSRVVTLKTPQAELKRPITKICPLPFQNDSHLTLNQ